MISIDSSSDSPSVYQLGLMNVSPEVEMVEPIQLECLVVVLVVGVIVITPEVLLIIENQVLVLFNKVVVVDLVVNHTQYI